MFKKILVPTDGSDYARRALGVALEIALKYGSAIELLHVAPMPQVYWGEPYAIAFTAPLQQLVAKGSHKILSDTVKGFDLGEVKVNQRQSSGYPAGVILDELSSHNIDLVVLGSHGHSGLAGTLLGSVSNRVVAQAACPVLVVK